MYRLLFGAPLAKKTMKQAIDTRDLETVKDTIYVLDPPQIDYTVTDKYDYEQMRYLNTAIVNGDLDIVKLLIEKKLTDCECRHSIAPILAISHNNLEMLKLLLLNGWVLKGDYHSADNYSNSISFLSNDNKSLLALHSAIKTDNKELIDFVFEQVSKNKKSNHVFVTLLNQLTVARTCDRTCGYVTDNIKLAYSCKYKGNSREPEYSHFKYLCKQPYTIRNIILKVLKEYPDKVKYNIDNHEVIFIDAVKTNDTEIIREFITLGYNVCKNWNEAAVTAEQYYSFDVYRLIIGYTGAVPNYNEKSRHYIQPKCNCAQKQKI